MTLPRRRGHPAAATARVSADRLLEVFRALSDPTRLRIVAALGEGDQCVCDLVQRLDAHQSRLSFHVGILKRAGLVADRRDGRWIHYSLNPEALDELRSAIDDLTSAARSVAARCCGA